MKEVITISVGQCGIQCSNATWELYCMEHGVGPDGCLTDENILTEDDSYLSFYEVGPRAHLVPRTIVCDLEATVVDEIRVGNYRSLYHPDCLINGIEDAANNYARGHYTVGKGKINSVIERLRKTAQNCDMLEGFVLINGIGGGTGSGLGDLILQKLNTEFSKRTKIQTTVFPGAKYSTAVVEPYNCVLSVHSGIEDADLVLQFDNDATYEICKRHLSINRPTYNNINRLVSQVLSSLTCAIRFKNALASDLTMMQVNMVPYPRIHFPVPSFSPFYMVDKAEHQSYSVNEITRDVFDSTFQLATCDLLQGKFMACTLQYRGTCSPRNVNDAVAEIKKRAEIQFVDWCPTGFKMGICRQPTLAVPKSEISPCEISVSCLANNTNVGVMWQRLMKKFDVMFSKRSFLHWYVCEGMEEGEFMEARDDMIAICKDYEECGNASPQEGGEEGLAAPEEEKTEVEAFEEPDVGAASSDIQLRMAETFARSESPIMKSTPEEAMSSQRSDVEQGASENASTPHRSAASVEKGVETPERSSNRDEEGEAVESAADQADSKVMNSSPEAQSTPEAKSTNEVEETMEKSAGEEDEDQTEEA